MTISLKHSFQSSKVDGGDPSLVQSSNWNAEHNFTAAAGKVIGRDTSGAGSIQELPIAVDTSGNVGIGTNSPAVRLAVDGTPGATYSDLLRLNTAASGPVNISFGDSGTTSARPTIGGSGNALVFGTNITERMRIDSSGNVGIGTASPGAKLTVAGSGKGSIFGSTSALNFYSAWQYNNTDVGYIGNGAAVLSGAGSTDFGIDAPGVRNLCLGTNDVERFRIESGGSSVVRSGNAFRLNRSDDAVYNEIKYDTSDTFAFNQANGGQYSFRISATQYLGLTTTYLAPGGNGTMNLGLAANRWNTVYAAVGTINTSDVTEKQQVRALDDAEMAVAVRLKSLIRAYKFNDAVEAKGDDARIHVGVIAQDVKAAFEAEGLDASRYGVFCSDTWTNDEGEEVTRMGVRYGELFAFIIAAM